jgi:hypothetical protein
LFSSFFLSFLKFPNMIYLSEIMGNQPNFRWNKITF